MSEKKPRWGGCAKALGIGCLVVGFLGVIVVVLVAANLDSLRESEWFRSISQKAEAVREEAGHMLELRGELLGEFPARDLKVSSSTFRSSQASVRSLVLTFEGASFLGEEGWTKERARAIAQRAAQLHPKVEGYQRIVVVSRAGAGGVVSVSRDYAFDTEELLQALEALEALEASSAE